MNADPIALDRLMKSIHVRGRDYAFLPMQWDSLPYAAFTTSKAGAWMRTYDLYPKLTSQPKPKNRNRCLVSRRRYWLQGRSTRICVFMALLRGLI
jgi:hypothetical protein